MTPSLSVVIPVWNDSDALASCLTRLRDPSAPPAEIIICDASPAPAEKSRVAELATRHAARLLACPQPSRGAQLAAGAVAATNDVIVFTHADTTLTATHLHAVTHHLATHPTLQAGAFHRDVASLYPNLTWATPFIRWWMAELGTIYGDQSPFIRRQTLARFGGYPPLPIMEDMAFSDQMRQQLARDECRLLDPPLPTSPRRFRRRGTLRNKLHNLTLIAAWRFGAVSPEKIHQLYYQHRSEGET
jgi:glycosyltransferase involved in cell wall biosynthesis